MVAEAAWLADGLPPTAVRLSSVWVFWCRRDGNTPRWAPTCPSVGLASSYSRPYFFCCDGYYLQPRIKPVKDPNHHLPSPENTLQSGQTHTLRRIAKQEGVCGPVVGLGSQTLGEHRWVAGDSLLRVNREQENRRSQRPTLRASRSVFKS